jgi:hypothetical protein
LQTPLLQESVVQALPSLQLLAVEQGSQPAIVVCLQTPLLHESAVQAFPSLQSFALEQRSQPAIGVLRHWPR